uniref:H-type lectin domain-containing protein n=1 Tax=Candidatus Kentrum sp. FW TaxID=2126338 RepID=A0A450T7K0_9GAMM|nr:MAG: H-type lectin domain-containing protein [Candidatus Kentron sp. FW]
MGINTAAPTANLDVNGSSRLGNTGTVFQAMQLGKINVGGSGGNTSISVTVTFNEAFTVAPDVVLANVIMPSGTSGSFIATIKDITTSQVVFDVRKRSGTSWTENLDLAWQAYEL